MQKIICYVVAVIVCFSISNVATAQKNDAIKAPPSVIQRDTVYTIYINNEKSDSLVLNAKQVELYPEDSLYSKAVIAHKYQMQEALFKKNNDTFRRVFKTFQKDQDSLTGMQQKLKRAQAYQQLNRLDSFKRKTWKTDSIRIKGQLQQLRSGLQKLKEDSARQNKNFRKREVSIEVPCDKNGAVFIKNLARKIIVRTSKEAKVRLVTTVYVEAGFESKDMDWEKELNVEIEQNINEVIIKRPDTRTVTVSSSTAKSMTINYSNTTIAEAGSIASSRIYNANNKSEMLIYVPAGVKLNIENRYNELAIMNNVRSLDLDLTNSDLKMEDADKAVIKSKYGTIRAGAIKDADIDLLNCKFTSGDLEKLLINSKYSTVTFENSGVINITSVSDQYNIAKANYATVKKSFGKLNIGYLANSIVMAGSSADLNIGKIDNKVKLVSIENKYADVKLPLAALENYTLKFGGNYNNIYTAFDKIKTNAADSMWSPHQGFTKTVGNVNKNFTAFEVNCTSCSVDFR